MQILTSIFVFVVAALFEIGGCYLVWLWLKHDKPVWYGITGGIILALYGVVATQQTSGFGRVYAAYGAFFIVMSILWAWKFDRFIPDKFDLIGALLILIGAGIMYFAPRT